MEMITVQNRKPTGGETVMLAIGALLFFAGILMMISLILFLPGIGAFLVGFLLMYFGRPKAIIECTNCGGDVIARLNDKQAKCEHCDTVHPITWKK